MKLTDGLQRKHELHTDECFEPKISKNNACFCKLFSILSIGKFLAQCLLLACYHFLLLLFCANLILLAHCAFTPLPQLHSNHLGNFNTAECSCFACPSLNQFKGLSVLTYHELTIVEFGDGAKK